MANKMRGRKVPAPLLPQRQNGPLVLQSFPEHRSRNDASRLIVPLGPQRLLGLSVRPSHFGHRGGSHTSIVRHVPDVRGGTPPQLLEDHVVPRRCMWFPVRMTLTKVNQFQYVGYEGGHWGSYKHHGGIDEWSGWQGKRRSRAKRFQDGWRDWYETINAKIDLAAQSPNKFTIHDYIREMGIRQRMGPNRYKRR